MKLKVLIAIMLIFLTANYAQAIPDFGDDGLKGLSDSQIKELLEGKIIVSTSDTALDETTQVKSSLITAIMILNKPPEETYNLLYHTEDQIKFLEEIKDIKIIRKGETQDDIEFKLRAAIFTLVYRVIHNFDRGNLYMYWSLDKNFKNDLEDLHGFWKLYPYPGSKTLVRYGSNVSLKNVPTWVENIFKKSGVRNALKNVKKHIDTGWTLR